VWAHPVAIELPSRKPGLVTDRTADQLAAATKPVNRLRRSQLQERLYILRPYRAVDEVLDECRRAGKTAADSEHPWTSPQGRRERAVSVDFGSGGA